MFKNKTIEDTIYRLSDLLDEIQMVVHSSFDRSYWVIAEIVSVSEAKNGHLYLEIAEKENDFLQAKIRANIWSNSKRRILSEFEHATNQSLKRGMKVLINVTIEFHNVFGLSFNILDIDPNFSLGEIERQKKATLKQLEQEGLIDFNKQHVLAPVLQSIAIISSKSAAGYQDFMKQLDENSHGYTFQSALFQAIMQGETASESIIQAIDKIEKNKNNFDVIVLIRGGGSSLDLSCFDEYILAARLAQSHYPIFTGIGHERDISIADKVAHTQLKTPTAVADFIIAHNNGFENEIDSLAEILNKHAFNLVDYQKQLLSNLSKSLSYSSQQKINKNDQRIIHFGHNYKQAVKSRLTKGDFRLNKIEFILEHDLKIKFTQNYQNLNREFEKVIKGSQKLLQNHQNTIIINSNSLSQKSLSCLESKGNNLDQIKKLIHLADPKQILKKGFSITRLNGKILESIIDVDINTEINTELYDGNLESKITNKK